MYVHLSYTHVHTHTHTHTHKYCSKILKYADQKTQLRLFTRLRWCIYIVKKKKRHHSIQLGSKTDQAVRFWIITNYGERDLVIYKKTSTKSHKSHKEKVTYKAVFRKTQIFLKFSILSVLPMSR